MSGAPGVAVGLSIVLRAAYLLQIQHNPYFSVPIMDEGFHDLWAREIASGDLTARIPFFRAPLYPFLLGLAYRLLGGPDFTLIRATQLLVGAVTPALVHAIARRLLPGRPRVAAAAAILVALDGVLLYFEADLLLESLLAPLGALLVLLILRAGESGTPRRWFLAGLGLGLFAITRPNILLFAPPAFLLALGWKGETFRLRRRLGASALALTAGTCLLVLPVTVANWRVGGDPILIASQGGLNFFLGNNEEANGWSATAPSVFRIDWWGGYEDAIAVAEEAVGHRLLPSEVSDYWYGRAFAWWRENPGRALTLTLKKTVFFLSGIEFGNNRDMKLFFREFATWALPFLYLLYGIMPLALLGAVGLWRRQGVRGRVLVLFVAVYALSIILFFVTARYRVPLRPLLAVFAVEGATIVIRGLRESPWRGAGPAFGAVLLGIAVNANPWVREYQPSAAQFYQSVANVHHDQGNLAEAVAWQRRALDLDPTYPKGNLNLGSLYMAMGNLPGAIESFQRERVLDPDDGENLASLAQALDRAGRLEEAERAYTEAEAHGLEDAPALYNHALCLERLGRPVAEAEAMYRRVVDADSAFADAWNNLGVIQARQGNLDAAIPLWEKALEVRPGYPRARENLDRAHRLAGDPGGPPPD